MAEYQHTVNEGNNNQDQLVSLSSIFHTANNINIDEDQFQSKKSKLDLPFECFKLPSKKWNEIYGDLGLLSYKSKSVCKLIEMQVVVKNDQPHSFINLLSSKEIQSLVK